MMLRIIDNTTSATIGTVAVIDGDAVCSGAGHACLDMRAVDAKGRPLTPADGDAWLRALGDAFRGDYYSAELEEEPAEE